ncbi:MAG: hypothetical protein ATN35_09075 [Epulopiscium sp. Nele67-Bin004]|nr:MAG: hypothetical protein ATN35_09075 [Epulopiscium sp. Nele67-Bin004]
MKKIFMSICLMSIIVVSLYLFKDTLFAFNIGKSNNYPVVTVVFSNNKEVVIELYPSQAPNTVNNFLDLADQGFYEYTFVSRIIPGYFVQAGDPIGDGYGYPGYYIESECKYNGTSNSISLTRGTVSMARGQDFNTEGSQFFILTQDARHLNGQYSAFGKVISGMEVIDNFGTTELDSDYQPKQDIFIKEVKVELNGYEPQAPEVYLAD